MSLQRTNAIVQGLNEKLDTKLQRKINQKQDVVDDLRRARVIEVTSAEFGIYKCAAIDKNNRPDFIFFAGTYPKALYNVDDDIWVKWEGQTNPVPYIMSGSGNSIDGAIYVAISMPFAV